MEYYDGNKLTEEINPVMRDVNWSIFYIFYLFSMFSVRAFFWPYCRNDYIFYVCFLCCCSSTTSFTHVRCCTIKSSTPSTRSVSLQCWTSTESGDAVLISKMTAASLWTFRISGIKKHVYICVCLSALYVTCLRAAVWKYSILWCGNFYVLFLFEFVNWNSGNVFLCTFFFYLA
jgi:hypothetical protein